MCNLLVVRHLLAPKILRHAPAEATAGRFTLEDHLFLSNPWAVALTPLPHSRSPTRHKAIPRSEESLFRFNSNLSVMEINQMGPQSRVPTWPKLKQQGGNSGPATTARFSLRNRLRNLVVDVFDLNRQPDVRRVLQEFPVQSIPLGLQFFALQLLIQFSIWHAGYTL
jgi:hypothetical protein